MTNSKSIASVPVSGDRSVLQMTARHEIFEGQSWTIEERHHGGAWSLIFSADSVTRRVWHYPENWRRLVTADLFALTYSPTAIRRRMATPKE